MGGKSDSISMQRLVKDIRKGDSLIFSGETYKILERKLIVYPGEGAEKKFYQFILEGAPDALLTSTWGFLDVPDTQDA